MKAQCALVWRIVYLGLTATALIGCAQPNRMGMVEDRETGLMWGSAVERNLVLDASQLENRNARVVVRNISGDGAYDLTDFRGAFVSALAQKGFKPIDADDFGVRFDINVLYSGQISTNLMKDFAFLGGAAGGVAGYGNRHEVRNSLGGIVSGAAIGAVIGSNIREDTYITIAEVTIGVLDPRVGTSKKTITFSSSPPLQEERRSGLRPFDQILSTKIAVYAGGRNIAQREIAAAVRARMARIVQNIP
jgi:hypothetical protein